MVREIYVRTPDDPNYASGVIDFSNEVESVITQIRMILGTNNGDVLGDHVFGVNLDYLVFNTIKNTFEIKEKINDQISAYVRTGKNITVTTDISFGKEGNGCDYAVVDIYINGVKSVGFLVDRENYK